MVFRGVATKWKTGRGAVWLAYLTGGQGVGGSNPLVPTILRGLRFYAVGSFLFCVNFAPILAFTSPLPGKQKPRAI